VAHSTLAVPSYCEFPQLLEAAMERFLARVERIADQAQLSLCDYESPESSYGAADGVPCNRCCGLQSPDRARL
jgi:hypothetical protein